MILRLAKDLGFYLSAIISGVLFYLSVFPFNESFELSVTYDFFFIFFFSMFLISYIRVLQTVYLNRIEDNKLHVSKEKLQKFLRVFLILLYVITVIFIVLDVCENSLKMFDNKTLTFWKFFSAFFVFIGTVVFDCLILKSYNHILSRLTIALTMILFTTLLLKGATFLGLY